ncbi:FAD-dependent oxidoreductase [Paenibacillus contaminans]|uniref:FAD-dependent oxidoreductase n=1 Tax=Paenibacillus contaminans TaxID=450362 RepID=A0A329MFN6_9BACL|nr:FAD-dependent oxidoreductase [Paenibacillus contaminans]RAV16047.1 FAD-dependent oxidoreductase [Paenibacillus contaminans]
MTKERNVDIAVIGGGMGGCAAALAAASMGKTVVLTEETDWIGGQMTSQAVPPDEHGWIEKFGSTHCYRKFRKGVRDYYRNHFPLTAEARSVDNFNPGSAFVSRIAHEPRTALAVLQQMLAPYIHSGRIMLMLRHVPEQAETEGDDIRSVTVRSLDSNERTVIAASYFLDATECGDMLPLAGVEYVTGSESKAETGEDHALEGPAQPYDMQAITHVFAVDHLDGEDHTIDKPKDYSFWRDYKPDFWPDKLLSWSGVYPSTLEHRIYDFFPAGEGFDLWRYRRIIDKSHFRPGTFASDITIINWPQNDYFIGPVIDVGEEERTRHLEQAKQLSLSLLYWMQTEAPRPDGKIGYPGLRLRKDVVGTEDGLAKYPYIRESRRICAEFTVLEQHVSKACNSSGVAKEFYDSVGIGYYPIDLHPSTGNRHYIDFASVPFQIPLGSLLPVRVNNLLPACKNIGTTHITNGCYRLHPVEWGIGEAAGHLAAFCLSRQTTPRAVRNDENLLAEFQRVLERQGVELKWPFQV